MYCRKYCELQYALYNAALELALEPLLYDVPEYVTVAGVCLRRLGEGRAWKKPRTAWAKGAPPYFLRPGLEQ